jgi:hypothetical protein
MVHVRPEAPSGQQLETFQFPVLFEGGNRGANIVAKMNFQVDQEGLYWFDVLLGGTQLLTRVPLEVVYQPQPGRTGTP